MARIDVLMPQMGESIAEGTLSKWLKKVGETVKRDEPLFEISTDKVDAEIPAPNAGTLAEIKVQEGQTVPVQTLVAVIETEQGAAATITRLTRYVHYIRERPAMGADFFAQAYFVPSSFSNSDSVNTGTSSSFALSYFDPGSVPTTT